MWTNNYLIEMVRRFSDGAVLVGGAVTLNLGLTLWSFNAFPTIFDNAAYDVFRENHPLLLTLAYGFILCGIALYLSFASNRCCFRPISCAAAVALYVVMIKYVFWPHSATAIVTYGTILSFLAAVAFVELVDDILGA